MTQLSSGPGLDEQCKDKTGGQKPVAQRNLTTGVAREFSEHGCTGPWCCSACNQLLAERVSDVSAVEYHQ